MPKVVVFTCQTCDQQCLIPASKVSTDQLEDALSAHLLARHPSKPPGEAREFFESELESLERKEVPSDTPLGEWHDEI